MERVVARSKRGFCLAVWSDRFSSWVSVAVSEDRELLRSLVDRLVLAGSEPHIVVCDSCEDDDVEAALARKRAPFGAFVVHPRGDLNA